MTGDAVRITNWFIGSSLVVTTLNYYAIAGLHNLKSLHANLLSLSAVVFMYSASLNHRLQIRPSIHTISLNWLTSQLSLTINGHY
jgi:hypothetical protein